MDHIGTAERVQRGTPAAEDSGVSTAALPGSLLDQYGVVGLPEDPELHSIARLAAHVCGVPSAAVNLIDATSQHMVAAEGAERGVTPREDSMCATTVLLDEPVHVPDARTDPRFAENPFVTGRIARLRFYAGSQLRMPGGETVGTLCVFDEQPRELDDAQRAALDDLATQVVQVLQLRSDARRLTEANVELHRSNSDLSAFAGRIAHDLRNPIAATKGFLSLARGPFGEELSGRARECVEHAEGAVTRMAELVDSLLAFANVGARPRSIATDVGAVARDLTHDVEALVRATDGTIEIGELPVVQTDPTLLRQLLQNLVTNGLKYSRTGVPPEVRITGGSAGAGWWVSVADNGRGIPQGERGAVFEPFVRLPSTQDVAGSGIGLATCARIAEALGARIEISDSDGGGTTFTIRV
jgi:signal transduction histidine kinase